MRELERPEVYKLKECLEELAAHHNEVSRLFAGCYPKRPVSDTLASFEADVESGRSRIAVIDGEGEILGFCKIDITGTDGKIDYLIVLRKARGHGYGDRLIGWAMDVFGQSGVKTIELRVVDGNDAVSFYEKYGFRVSSLIMRKDI
ncbi:MAG: GNAT family N-acetyltransferase [Ruminiclostridium sp.]|nr:GNAT family N-acetyltransferase [Ruminiclostridium sp.]